MSTDAAKTYYVIQCAATGEYLCATSSGQRVWTLDEIKNGNYRKTGEISNTSYDANGFLWYFTDAGSGQVKIGNRLKAQFLLNTTATAGDIGNFDATGTSWTLLRADNNCEAFRVSDGTDYCQNHSSGLPSYYYIQMASLGSNPDDNYAWVFKSYNDLLSEAEANGVTTSGYATDDPSGTDFQTLIAAINTAKSSASVPTIDDGSYLIRNRRSGLYLNTNGTAMAGVSTPTQYTVWRLTTIGGLSYLVSLDNAGQTIRVSNNNRRGDDAEAYWMLTGDQSYSVTFEKSSDGDARYVKMSYTFSASQGIGDRNPKVYFAMKTEDKSIYSTLTSGITSDWEFVPVNDYAYSIDNSITDEAQLLPADENAAHAPFFRLRNVARSVDKYADDQFDGGGWLEDVDHVHFEYRLSETASTAFDWEQTEAQLMNNAKDVDFYAAVPNATHASALWQFELIGRASAAGESATGLISPEHNIYILKNANTGKYLGKETQTVGGVAVLKEKTKKAQAIPFYLEKLFDGQYLLNVYGGTTNGVDAANGSITVTGTASGYQGGVTKGATKTAAEAVNTNAAWIIIPSPTLELQFLNITTNDGYSWSTFYYPFDVEIGSKADGQTVNIYQGGWQRTPLYNSDGSANKVGVIEMNEVVDVPAGNPVFVRSTKNGSEPYGNIILNVYPAGTMAAQTETSAFADNVWKGIVESEGHYFGDDWRNYWVLTRNSSGDVKLLHPAGSYLLPNRAYIDSETTERLNANISKLQMVFPEDQTTGISVVETFQGRANGIYDLQGRKLDSNAQLSKGIYIINGKKVIIK